MVVLKRRFNPNLRQYGHAGLDRTRNDINLCKVIHVKARYTNLSWSPAYGGGEGHINYLGTNKCLIDDKELNTFITLTMYKSQKTHRNTKAKSIDISDLEDESEQFNFKNKYRSGVRLITWPRGAAISSQLVFKNHSGSRRVELFK